MSLIIQTLNGHIIIILGYWLSQEQIFIQWKKKSWLPVPCYRILEDIIRVCFRILVDMKQWYIFLSKFGVLVESGAYFHSVEENLYHVISGHQFMPTLVQMLLQYFKVLKHIHY